MTASDPQARHQKRIAAREKEKRAKSLQDAKFVHKLRTLARQLEGCGHALAELQGVPVSGYLRACRGIVRQHWLFAVETGRAIEFAKDMPLATPKNLPEELVAHLFYELLTSRSPRKEAPATARALAAGLTGLRQAVPLAPGYFLALADWLVRWARNNRNAYRKHPGLPLRPCKPRAKLIKEKNPAAAQLVPNEPTIAPDGSWLTAHGETYQFTKGIQSNIILTLWKTWEQAGREDGCGLSEEAIGEAVGSRAQRFRVLTAFRGHPVLKGVLKRTGKGQWAVYLAAPRNRSPEIHH